MTHFHFGPFTPDLSEILDILEVDLGGLLKNLTGTSEVRFRFACGPAFFVELGKVNIQAVEVRCGPARSNGRECACVRLCDLEDMPDQLWWRNQRPWTQTFSSS
jgi:hypothetical protein